jgi:hypothetical protein
LQEASTCIKVRVSVKIRVWVSVRVRFKIRVRVRYTIVLNMVSWRAMVEGMKVTSKKSLLTYR